MRALVTGANGLICASLARELLRRGLQVRALVRANSDIAALSGLDVELAHADVTVDAEALEHAAQGCSLVFHTAMHFSYDRARAPELEAAAMRGTENVLRAAKAATVARVVVTSSAVVFGYSLDGAPRDESYRPAVAGDENPYVGAKIRQATLALELGATLGLAVVAACPTVCVGPHGTTLGPSNGAIVTYLMDPLRATYAGGCNVASTLDVAEGHWLIAQHGTPGECYILGGQNLSWRALHSLIADLAGVDLPRIELNHTLSYLGAAAEELRARAGQRIPVVTRDQAAMVGRYYWYADAKARRLGYSPRAARAALAAALSWLATSSHVSRELRASLRLHEDVHAERSYGAATIRALAQ